MNNQKRMPAYAILAIISLVAALVLAVTNAFTAGPIEEHRMAALVAAYGEVMPVDEGGKYVDITADAAGYDVQSLYRAEDASGNTIGYCVTASKKGYGGPVAVTLGVNKDGMVTGCVVGDTSFAESAGFGTRALEPAFREQFEGLDAVNGGTIEKLSGASVTSGAVLNATNAALKCLSEKIFGHEVDGNDLIAFGARVEKPAASAEDLIPGGWMSGEAEGFGGAMITVTYQLGDDLTIAKLELDVSSQTPGIGQRCADEKDFAAAFIGQSIPAAVDALSGATITSEAVVKAVNSAAPCEHAEVEMPAAKIVAENENATIGLFDNGAAVISGLEGYTGPVTVELKVENGKVSGGSFVAAAAKTEEAPSVDGEKAQAPGFGGDPVTVYVTRNEDGTIASLKVDASNQMAGIGMACEKEEFTSQFIGKKGPFAEGDIDVCSGATFTSKGVIEAVNSLYMEPAPVEEAPAIEGEKAQAPGFGGDPVTVYVTRNEDGTIAALKVDASNQMAGIGMACEKEEFTSQFIGKKGPFAEGDIDVCSGATFTSKGVIEAVNSLYMEPAPVEEAPAIEGEKAQAPGFGGDPVTVYVTRNEDGTIAALKVDASNQMAGIGMACEKEEFTSQFIGKKGPFAEGDIDVCSGATFTSKGVIEAVNSLYMEPAPVEEAPAIEGEKAQAPGFGGDPVTVYVTRNEDGTIAALKVDASNQMAGIGMACEKEEFTSQFIGKKGPFAEGDIDVCSGATFTSKGVIEAVNSLYMEPAPVEEAPAIEGEKAQAPGFAGDPVTVYVVKNEDGTIATLTVDASNQMEGIGRVCEKEAFTSQFIGKAGPFSEENIDVCSGATFTSKGVIEAVNSLMGN